MNTPIYGIPLPVLGENPRSTNKIDNAFVTLEARISERAALFAPDVTIIGNTGATGPDVLTAKTLPANTLTTNGWTVRVHGKGDFGANGTTKNLWFTLGAASAVAIASGAFNNLAWEADITIARLALDTQLLWATCLVGTTWQTFARQLPAQDENAPLSMFFSATGGADNDIRQLGMWGWLERLT